MYMENHDSSYPAKVDEWLRKQGTFNSNNYKVYAQIKWIHNIYDFLRLS